MFEINTNVVKSNQGDIRIIDETDIDNR